MDFMSGKGVVQIVGAYIEREVYSFSQIYL